MNQEQKFEQWAERELIKNLDRAIFDDDNGGYIAFGKYNIKPTKHGVEVRDFSDMIHCFMNKRHAMTWCIVDNNGNYMMANRIIALDQKKQSLHSDIHTRRTLGERMQDANSRETVFLKISSKQETLTSINRELDKCIGYAKYLQTKGFTNETARTSRA